MLGLADWERIVSNYNSAPWTEESADNAPVQNYLSLGWRNLIKALFPPRKMCSDIVSMGPVREAVITDGETLLSEWNFAYGAASTMDTGLVVVGLRDWLGLPI